VEALRWRRVNNACIHVFHEFTTLHAHSVDLKRVLVRVHISVSVRSLVSLVNIGPHELTMREEHLATSPTGHLARSSCFGWLSSYQAAALGLAQSCGKDGELVNPLCRLFDP